VPKRKPPSDPNAISIRIPGRRYKGDPPPVMGPPTRDEWFRSTLTAIQQKDATLDTREEYQKLLDLYPVVAQQHGDLAAMARKAARGRVESQPMIEEAIKHQSRALRTSLSGDDATPLELLLIDAILACWHDYYLFALMYGQKPAHHSLSQIWSGGSAS
jgi:hypothetical protein